MRVKTLVITGYGTNCERESAHAAKASGSDVTDIAYFSDLVTDKVRLTDYNFLIFPGGFLDGDDLGAAHAAAIRWRFSKTSGGSALADQLKSFMDRGGIGIGICNGFQLMVKLGLLPGLDGNYFERQVSLGINDSARFEDRWVTLKANPASPCIFTKGIDLIDLPVRHGEGKIVPGAADTLARLEAENLVALRYADPATGEPTQAYPLNPNGSPNAIAGLTDPSGRFLGLMPHPEAFNHPTNHPEWTRMRERGETPLLGLKLFESAIGYLKSR